MNDARPMRRPTRTVLTDGVYEEIKSLLMDQVIEPGARLNIESLARELGVSPTPVREALARLESDGLVTKRALQGYSVTDLMNPVSFRELFELRLVLEPYAARRAAELVTASELAALDAVVRAMGQTSVGASYAEYREFVAQDASFHAMIARASGNALLHATFERLRAHLHAYRLYVEGEIALGGTVAEHERIVRALSSRDGDAAANAMADHIREAQGRLLPIVQAIHTRGTSSGPGTPSRPRQT